MAVTASPAPAAVREAGALRRPATGRCAAPLVTVDGDRADDLLAELAAQAAEHAAEDVVAELVEVVVLAVITMLVATVAPMLSAIVPMKPSADAGQRQRQRDLDGEGDRGLAAYRAMRSFSSS